MKNIFKLFMLALLFIPVTFLFVACGKTPVELKADMISLEYSNIGFSGTQNCPAVTVVADGETVDEENYEVSYSNNISAGTATVTVVAKEDNKTLKGFATKNFTISKKALSADLIQLETESVVYSAQAQTPVVSVKIDDYVADLNGFDITYENNTNVGTATITVTAKQSNQNFEGSASVNFEITPASINVSSLEELNEAISTADSNHIIRLTNDIEYDQSSDNRVVIYPKEKDLDITIDTCGYDIGGVLRFTNGVRETEKDDSGFGAKVVILSSADKSQIGHESLDYASVYFVSDDFDVTFENIEFVGAYGGIATNGSFNGNSKVSAINCKFVSTNTTATTGKDAGVGALLSAGYTYNFNSCHFEGFGGYHAKSGVHNLVNCTVKATVDLSNAAYNEEDFSQTYYGNGSVITGSAAVFESCKGYSTPLKIRIAGGTFESKSKYAIEEFSTAKSGETPQTYIEEFIVTGATLISKQGLEGYDIDYVGAVINPSLN